MRQVGGQAGGSGWQLAEWIVEGEPGIDMLATDPRRFGCLLWQPAGETHELLRHLGPEPLSADFGGGHLVTGKGASTDVIEASARAYLNAVNRVLSGKVLARPDAAATP